MQKPKQKEANGTVDTKSMDTKNRKDEEGEGNRGKAYKQRWKLIDVVYFCSSAQAELCGGLSKLSVASAPLELR